MRQAFLTAILSLTAAAAVAGPAAAAAGDPEIAALQVGLRARGLYSGTVDGVLGPGTRASLRRFQRRARLNADGVPGPRTRAAMGHYGQRAPLGHRTLVRGMRGWDVAALQFELAWHGFPSGPFDGRLGARTDAALRRFQVWAGLQPDGTASHATIAVLRGPLPSSPLSFIAPVNAPTGDSFGPRGAEFHSGLDFPAPKGTPVTAAGPGQVVFAGRHAGGWGRLVVVEHSRGVRTLYAHLSGIDVRVGRRVGAGSQVGLVGASGRATGPHLHFEVLVRGAAVDPAGALSRLAPHEVAPARTGPRKGSRART
jgi:peptidoglycan hydrolase-like protein with peptidoglycan-binding domain